MFQKVMHSKKMAFEYIDDTWDTSNLKEDEYEWRSQQIQCVLAKEGQPVCPLGMKPDEEKPDQYCVWIDSQAELAS